MKARNELPDVRVARYTSSRRRKNRVLNKHIRAKHIDTQGKVHLLKLYLYLRALSLSSPLPKITIIMREHLHDFIVLLAKFEYIFACSHL